MRAGREIERSPAPPSFRPGPAASALGHHVLQLFRDLEHRDLARRHRNRFSRAGVTSDPGLAVLHAERAEAADLDVMAALKRTRHGVEERVHRLGDVLLGQARSLRNLVHDIRLRHLDLLTGWLHEPTTEAGS